MVWEKWPARWEEALAACRAKGGDVLPLVVAPPATPAELQEVEVALGLRLPESLRSTLLGFSKQVQMSWQLPHGTRPPDELRSIFGGDCTWDLSQLVAAEQTRLGWIEAVFSDPEDPYARVWHGKLAFMFVANGDQIAFDMSNPPEAPVVYLSHDGGEGHGYLLGHSFQDFIDRWSILGCPGNEDWQMMPFMSSATSGLDPYGEVAQRWRKWFGLTLPFS